MLGIKVCAQLGFSARAGNCKKFRDFFTKIAGKSEEFQKLNSTAF